MNENFPLKTSFRYFEIVIDKKDKVYKKYSMIFKLLSYIFQEVENDMWNFSSVELLSIKNSSKFLQGSQRPPYKTINTIYIGIDEIKTCFINTMNIIKLFINKCKISINQCT